MAYTTVVAGTSITASWGNANVRDQVVTPFASAAARTSAIVSPVDGMVSSLTDTHSLEMYNGSSWTTITNGTGWTTYTPTVTWGTHTIASPTGRWIKDQFRLWLLVSFQVTVLNAGGAVSISTPAAYTSPLTVMVGTILSTSGSTFIQVAAGAFSTVVSPASPTATVSTYGGVLTVPTTV